MAEQDRRGPDRDEGREPEEGTTGRSTGPAEDAPADSGPPAQAAAPAPESTSPADTTPAPDPAPDSAPDSTPGSAPGFDEEAAWAAIVAGYGEEPPDPPGAKPFKSFRPVRDLHLPEPADESEPDAGGNGSAADGTGEDGKDDRGTRQPAGAGGRLGGSVSFAPGVGPRDYTPEPDPEEDHFVPPDPPLPEADVTAKFAWLAVVGGPVLMLVAVMLRWEMTWWLTTLCVGGFVGGFATLVLRMQSDDEDDDPGRGAVV
ncbi:hypothetical protein [Streptomyces sp. NPDC058045]|uniref:hypothetical protein n=1 Tax=Streptomyces sp. NPDC058045 TaxID=3346311 RepID=UPI0036EC3DA3